MRILRFLRDWALIFSMLFGVLSYIVFINIPDLRPTAALASKAVSILQPALIFCMLLLTFCKINPRQIRFCRWHLWLLLIQGGLFVGIGLLLIFMPHSHIRIALEGAMILLICPTATAAPVITNKLGGSLHHITTYTILINLLAAVLIPIMLPYVHPTVGMSTIYASTLIMGKVFPILLLPLILAMIIRHYFPKLQRWLTRWPDAPFYLWVVSLSLAMTVTTRSIYHSNVGIGAELWLVCVSLVCCIAQFALGWRIGKLYGDRVTAGQAFGQKNTVFAIWLGYTFFTPITSIAGGFYSIWHNVINSYQLYKHKNHTKPEP